MSESFLALRDGRSDEQHYLASVRYVRMKPNCFSLCLKDTTARSAISPAISEGFRGAERISAPTGPAADLPPPSAPVGKPRCAHPAAPTRAFQRRRERRVAGLERTSPGLRRPQRSQASDSIARSRF